MNDLPETPLDPETGPCLVLVTGLSGAGKTTALKQFEDLGWDVADNIPLSLLSGLVAEIARQGGQNVAVGVDSRTFGFSAEVLHSLIEEHRSQGNNRVRLLFLECDEGVLQRRFTETRRRHPLATDRPVADGIKREKILLKRLKEKADILIDSTLLSLPELRQILIGQFSLEDQPALSTTVVSFSFKKGVPREADLVFDVRFLQNPYYDLTLRPGTGQDQPVADFVGQDAAFEPFMDQLEKMLDLLLPRYQAEGKSYLTIAIGCTGGRHRSVCVAENIHDRIERKGYFTHLVHRDMEKSGL
ncbi:RNase adapter RapZ [Sneathiella aquimaris]|uniref:RNase adapter RapZ n=1 Tax=Sneathiella aquimaris TaxID=2599305 RepID=UPI00146AAF3D|nr:RNase adapter RapZ [Sneathiella aquimaris]